LEQDGPVAVLVIDDPPLNLFGRELCTDLAAAMDRVPDEARALLIRARARCSRAGPTCTSSKG